MGLAIDATTIAIAVDSTQVSSATTALDKFATSGNVAATSASKLTGTVAEQGKVLNASIAPGAAKAAVGFKDLAQAADKLGPAAAQKLADAVSKLDATTAKADASMQHLGDTAANAGSKAQAALSSAASVSVPSTSAASTISKVTGTVSGGTTSSAIVQKAGAEFSAINAATKESSKSIDEYVRKLQTVVVTNGMSARKTAEYELTLRGANTAQLAAADSAIKLDEAYKKGAKGREQFVADLKSGLVLVAKAALAGATAAIATFEVLIGKAATFQDMAERTGDTAQNIASLSVAAATGGVSMEAVVTAASALTKSLTGVNDESKAAGAAIKSLGLNLDDIKKMKTADQLQAIGKALNSFEEGPSKAAVAMALFNRGGTVMLSFLKELGNEGGRQVILTQAQIEAADAYKDAQARSRQELTLLAEAIATKMLPSVTDSITAAKDLAKEIFGLGDGAKDLAKNEGLTTFSDNAVRVLALIVDNIDFVVRGFQVLGSAIAITAGVAVAAAKGQFKEAAAIAKEGDKDIKGILERSFYGDKVEARIAARKAAAAAAVATEKIASPGDFARLDQVDKQELKFDGAVKKPKGGGTGAADRLRKSDLEADLKVFKDALDAERAALTLHDKLLQGEYRAGNVSLKDFYADKVATTAAAVKAELAELDKERARIAQEIKVEKDPAKARTLKSRFDETGAAQEKIRVKAAGDIKLSNQEEAASFKALGDAVTEYRASLLQLQGDELGAAKLRAGVAIEKSKDLAKQSGGLITDADIAKEEALTAAKMEFIEVQRKSGLVASDTARAEETFLLTAEQSGKSLQEIESGVYDIRSKAVVQLGILNDAAKELLKTSTDPVLIRAAADIAKDYAKAVDAVNPALNRLRDATKSAADAISSDIGNALTNFTSIGDLAKNLGKTIHQALTRYFITEPLRVSLEATFNKATQGDGLFASFFRKGKDGKGIGEKDIKNDALLSQTTSINASKTALDLLTDAARTAADALGSQSTTASGKAPLARDTKTFAPTTGDFARMDRGQSGEDTIAALFEDAAKAQQDAREGIEDFGKSSVTATRDLAKLASAASTGGGALGKLPGVIGIIQSIVSALSVSSVASGASSGIGGLGGLLGGLFGKGGGSAAGAASDVVTSFIFHEGGVVGQPGATRSVPLSLFADAPRYHAGGIAGKDGGKNEDKKKKAAGIAPNEVLAILMRDEEVLKKSDPRHRDNLATAALAKVIAGMTQDKKNAKPGKEGEAIDSIKASAHPKEPDAARSISFLPMSGGREMGGAVAARSIQPVNEKGPELLSTGGKQFLMMGNQGGHVTPANQSGGGGITIHNAPVFNVDSRSDRNAVLADMRAVSREANADLVERLKRARKI